MASLQSLAQLLEGARGLLEGHAQLLRARAGLSGIEDLGQLLRQAFDEPLQGLRVGQPLAFRPFVKTLVLALGLLLVQRFDEEAWLLDHPLALYAVGLLVMREPSRQRAGRERLLADRSEQGLGIGLVGARQRQQNPVGGPARDLPRAHGVLKGLGQFQDPRPSDGLPSSCLSPGPLQLPVARAPRPPNPPTAMPLRSAGRDGLDAPG
jgi:hypothetical protein